MSHSNNGKDPFISSLKIVGVFSVAMFVIAMFLLIVFYSKLAA